MTEPIKPIQVISYTDVREMEKSLKSKEAEREKTQQEKDKERQEYIQKLLDQPQKDYPKPDENVGKELDVKA